MESQQQQQQQQQQPRSLLDEYQYDDEETMDLLQAIKNWNLKKRPCHESPPLVDDAGDASFGSTIGSHTIADYDTTITAVSTTTSKGGLTASSAAKSALPKTPLCNYSSRPSFLTARILRDDDLLPAPVDCHSSDSWNDVVEDGNGRERKGKEPNMVNRSIEVSRVESCLSATEMAKRPQLKNLKCPKGSENPATPPSLQQQQQQQQQGDKHLECPQALELLRQTAAELGLAKEELGSVLPTVQKLVRVITQHVPRLENFVEQVCETVMEPEYDHAVEQGCCFQNGTPRRNKGPSKKRRGKKNMEARKERMEVALKILKSGWGKTGNSTREATDNGKNGLQCLDVNGEHVVEHENMNNERDASSFFQYTDYQSYGEFTVQVKDQLAKHQQKSNVSHTHPVSSSNHNQDPLLTDAEALGEIKRLIEFEERYSHKVMDNLVHGEESCFVQTSSNNDSIVSEPHGDTVLQDLLRADTTTLRRFVLHFAYLFSVRQDHILGKMNELYVFSHEATNLIQDIKKCLNLPVECSIHSVARQVMAKIQSNDQK
jgi:hypothetical protein